METFIFLFFQRVLSGLGNGFGYANKKWGLWLAFGLMTGICLIGGFLFNGVACWVGLFVTVLCTFFKTNAFLDPTRTGVYKYIYDIHLIETVVTGLGLCAAIAGGGSIIMALCSIYPALLIHKGLINLGSGLSFFDVRTDDPTGATWGIPALGISIPRNSLKLRFIFTGFSLVVVVLYFIFDPSFSYNFGIWGTLRF